MQSMSGANTMDPVWQRLWLRCQQHDWQSMAFIGSSKRDPDGVLEIAHGMARLASELGQELTVFDARNLGLKDMGRMLAQIQSITSRGKRCIVVLKLVTENATTVPMAQNVDAALLGVFIGETSVVASSRTVEEVGRAEVPRLGRPQRLAREVSDVIRRATRLRALGSRRSPSLARPATTRPAPVTPRRRPT